MKTMILAALLALSSVAHAGISFEDIKVIVNEPVVAQYLKDNGITRFDSVTLELAAACGPNSARQYVFTYNVGRHIKSCSFKVMVQPSTGHCQNAPRVAIIAEELVCLK